MSEPLAGDVSFQMSDQHSDAFIRNQVVVLAEQRLSPTVRYAGWVPVSSEMAADSAFMDGFLDRSSSIWDRSLRPWKFADRNPMPALDLIPASVRRAQWRFRALRSRARDALAVLRAEATIIDDGDDW